MSSVQSYFEEIGYKNLDPFKLKALEMLISTFGNNSDVEIEKTSVGESTFVMWLKDTPEIGIAFTLEGLGTKNMASQSMYELTRDPKYFHYASQCTVAMIVNDLITLHALPVGVSMGLALGDSEWLKDEARYQQLLEGWVYACHLSGAIYMGGETPTLKKMVHAEYPVLSGAAWGIVRRNQYSHGGKIQDGDQIIFIKSSGIHANGLTAARNTALQLPDGYETLLSDGKTTYGDAILRPTINYVPLMRKLLSLNLIPHYSINITGHAFKKIARAPGMFMYRIKTLPQLADEFKLIQQTLGYSNETMYESFNGGVGFALIVSKESTGAIIKAIRSMGNFEAWHAGDVKAAEEKSVVLEQLGITYTGNTFDHN